MITITGTPKEIAALVDELQGRRDRKDDSKVDQGALTADKMADTGYKLGKPIPTDGKPADHAFTTDMLSETAERIACGIFDEASIAFKTDG